MGTVKVERIGGLGGFGGAHLKSRGECRLADLSKADQADIEALFSSTGKSAGKSVGKSRGMQDNAQMRDGFSYRISRETASGTETVEVPENRVPAALISSVRDMIE